MSLVGRRCTVKREVTDPTVMGADYETDEMEIVAIAYDSRYAPCDSWVLSLLDDKGTLRFANAKGVTVLPRKGYDITDGYREPAPERGGPLNRSGGFSDG